MWTLEESPAICIKLKSLRASVAGGQGLDVFSRPQQSHTSSRHRYFVEVACQEIGAVLYRYSSSSWGAFTRHEARDASRRISDWRNIDHQNLRNPERTPTTMIWGIGKHHSTPSFPFIGLRCSLVLFGPIKMNRFAEEQCNPFSGARKVDISPSTLLPVHPSHICSYLIYHGVSLSEEAGALRRGIFSSFHKVPLRCRTSSLNNL
jgi:hypothetical protein